MTDLNDEDLDALVARLHDSCPATQDMNHTAQGDILEQAAAVITALRQREAEAVAGAIEAAAALPPYDHDGDPAGPFDHHVFVLISAIRALHTDATRAALDRVRAEGMREAAEIAQGCDTLGESYQDHELTEAGRVARSKVTEIVGAILAAADKMEGK